MLRPPTIVQHLARTLETTLHPTVLGIALLDPNGGGLRVMHQAPPDAGYIPALLDQALRRRPQLIDRASPGAAGVPADAPPCWLTVPILARQVVTGAVVLGGPPHRYNTEDLARLEACAAVAAVALESAYLLDQVDTGKRTWADTVDAIALALCIVDGPGRVRRTNRAFAELAQTAPAAVIGRPWQGMVPPGWVEGIQAAIDTAGSGQEVDLVAQDRWYAVSAFPTSEGDLPLTVLIFNDRTERRRLQEQLVQSEKMSAIGQLVAGVAHDLNNPLASVLGFADFLVENAEIPPHLREPIRVIQQESLRAATIVRNLLSFARKQENRRRNLQVPALIEATLLLLRNQLMAQHIDVQVSCEADLPEIHADPNQLQQVLVNLITNASQATAQAGPPGEIRILARHWVHGVAIDIRDNGPGMSDEIARQVFEPFFTTKPEGAGTGLGLSICQGIMKEHGGRITLETSPGAGATFTIEIPASTEADTDTEPVDPGLWTGTRLGVLLIDDEPHIVHYLRTTLEAWGHAVTAASDGAAGLALATGRDFDLIICDLRMPRLGGREFFDELSSKKPAMARRVIFITGDTVRDDTLEFLDRVQRPVLNKPFSLSELRAAMAAAQPRQDPDR